MLQFSYKKKNESQAIIDYRGDRMTGSEVCRSDGYKRGRAAGENSRIRLAVSQIGEIKEAQKRMGKTVNYLAHKFRVSNSTVARALRTEVTTVSDD
jgi:hypothetical protein